MNIYYTKCGIEFKKSTKADVTGYDLKLLSTATDFLKVKDDIERVECRTCPFVVDVTEGWGENKKHIRFECRAGSKKPNHKTDWTGSLEDKNTIAIRSLDNNFLGSVLECCENHPELGASYTQDLADCRRNITVCCSSNKKGIAAKKELIEKFFSDKKSDPIDQINNMWKDFMKCGACDHAIDCGESVEYRKCELKKRRVSINQVACNNFESAEQETEEVKQDCTTPTRACGKCNAGHWYSEESTYVSVVADDGIKTTKRPCEPHTHYCYQFTEGQKKIAADKDFNPDTAPAWCPLEKDIEYTYETDKYESKDNAIVAQGAKVYELTCDSCAYRPGNAKKVCNRVGNNRVAAPGQEACEWYNNLKTGEMAPQQFEWNYEGGYPDCMYKDFPDSSVKRVYYTIPEKKLPEDAQAVNDTQTNEQANHGINHNEHRCINCSYYSGDNEANYHCSKLSAYKDSYGVPLPHANGCSDFDSKWAEKVNGTPEIDTHIPEIDTKTSETTTFDYSTVDADTAEVLRDKAFRITAISGKAKTLIGKELKEAQDVLSKRGYGCFEQWYTLGGFTKTHVYRLISRYEFVCSNLEQANELEQLPDSLIYEISKPSAPKELQEQVLSGDITTHKQYKEKEAEWKDRFEESRKQQETLRIEKQQAITKAFDAERKADRLEGEIEELRDQIDELKDQADQDPKLISTLKDRIRELEAELKDKPIEAAAVQVVEKVPKRAAHEIMQRLYGTLMAAKLISIQEINIVHGTAKFEDREAIIEFMENLQEIIPGYLEILKKVPYGEE